jgi:hypothetical protein
MKIQIAANFNKQTKDSKKKLVQFHVKGDDEKKPELNAMTRSVVVLNIDGVEQALTTEFSKSTKDAKKTVLEFIVKGDTSSENSYEFYRKAGSDVVLEIAESQMSIEEFRGDAKKRIVRSQERAYEARLIQTVRLNWKTRINSL